MALGLIISKLLLLLFRFTMWFPNATAGKPYSEEFSRALVASFMFANTGFLPMMLLDYVVFTVEPFKKRCG